MAFTFKNQYTKTPVCPYCYSKNTGDKKQDNIKCSNCKNHFDYIKDEDGYFTFKVSNK